MLRTDHNNLSMDSTLVNKIYTQWKFRTPEHTNISYEESEWINPNNYHICNGRSGVFVFADDDEYIIHFGATSTEKATQGIDSAILVEKTRGATQLKVFYTANDDDARVLVRDFINAITN